MKSEWNWICNKKRKGLVSVQFFFLATSRQSIQAGASKARFKRESLNDFLKQEELTDLDDGEPTTTCTEGRIDLVICNANLHALLRPGNWLLQWNVHMRPKQRLLNSYWHIRYRTKWQIHPCKRPKENRLIQSDGNARHLRLIMMAWDWRMQWCYMFTGRLAAMYQRSCQPHANHSTLKALLWWRVENAFTSLPQSQKNTESQINWAS